MSGIEAWPSTRILEAESSERIYCLFASPLQLLPQQLELEPFIFCHCEIRLSCLEQCRRLGEPGRVPGEEIRIGKLRLQARGLGLQDFDSPGRDSSACFSRNESFRFGVTFGVAGFGSVCLILTGFDAAGGVTPCPRCASMSE